jgi:hypothetical protein
MILTSGNWISSRPEESNDSLDDFGHGCHLATRVFKPNWPAISHFSSAD